MKVDEILLAIEKKGAELRIHDGRLEGKGLNQLDMATKELLKKNEIIILHFLCKQNPGFVIPEYSEPYIKEDGELVIPSNCHPKYKYWTRDKVGEWQPITKCQSLKETLLELKASQEVIEKYVKSG